MTTMKELTKGMVVWDVKGDDWVYVGCRTTTVGTTEHWFVQFIARRHWGTLYTYKATKPETLVRKFPSLQTP